MSPRPSRPARKRPTTADLIVLSLLCEQPMHGYHVDRELARRQVRDWAAVSRAQIYYSLDKLREEGWSAPVHRGEPPAAGPERQRFRTTAKGKRVLADALSDERWTTGRERPLFSTWLALSMHADRETQRAQIARRRAFVEAEAARMRATLDGIVADTEPIVPPEYFDSTRTSAVLMVELAIESLEMESRWLERVEARLGCTSA